MNIIKLDAIDSTNYYLKQLSLKKELDDYTVVTAEYQTAGRGQMGTIWKSSRGKNLIFSMLIKFENLPLQYRFYLSMAVSLGILTTLINQFDAEFIIKWPNDILADRDKIAGILIENTFRGNHINQSIIGIGINVNQKNFPKSLNKVTSLINLTKQEIDRDWLLQKLIYSIKAYIELLKNNKYNLLKEKYLNNLYGFNKEMQFEDLNKKAFKGIIKGVSEDGKLEMLVENKTIRKFNLKEIKFTNS